MIIDHVEIVVSNSEASKVFFEKALLPLGITVVMEWDGHIGMGRDKIPQFWIGQGEASRVHAPLHLAFAAENREQVRQFYAAALAAGAKDNGAPGLRPHYHADYYGAFVIGPDGHNIEAVCHLPA